jgi:hypothetical protein
MKVRMVPYRRADAKAARIGANTHDKTCGETRTT